MGSKASASSARVRKSNALSGNSGGRSSRFMTGSSARA
jgi:hypothetical protein